MTPEKIAPLAVYLAPTAPTAFPGRSSRVRNNEIFLFNQPRPIRDHASLRRLDAAEARRAAQGRLRARRSRRSSAPATCSTGIPVVSDGRSSTTKLMRAENSATVEHTYDPKDCMLYALGLGLGQDPMNEDELAFVYEKNLKVLPTLALVLGYPALLAAQSRYRRQLDQGRARRAGARRCTSRCPPQGTVIGQTRIIEVDRQGRGQGRAGLSERKVIDKASGELLATMTQTTFCRGDGGFGGPQARSAGAASDPGARAGCWSAICRRGRKWR